ncbi:MAG: CPBP family intramembrane glutamic endopeptidase [Myxococcota bacterium]|nr:CPBP family intramembrane glutamic endopeptidase [Myxococcota bacterium]
MPVVGRLGVYVGGILLIAAVLSPPLYLLASQGLPEALWDVLRKFKFPQYYNRVAMFVALVGAIPFLRSIGISDWKRMHLAPNAHWLRDLALGLGVGFGSMGLAAGVVYWIGAVEAKPYFKEMWFLMATGTAVAVALIEEFLFRGVLMAAFLRVWPERKTLAGLSLVFALLHFVGKHPSHSHYNNSEVDLWSGFRLIPELFWQFLEPNLVVGKFLTLTLVGFTLGWVTLKTRSLAVAIGLHCGWVWVLRMLTLATLRKGEPTFWIGRDLTTGLLALVVVGGSLVVLWLCLGDRRAESTPIISPD